MKCLLPLLFACLALSSCALITIDHQTSIDGLISAYEDKIPRMMKDRVPGVNVVLIKNNAVYYRKSFGLREVASQLPMTGDTIFQVASISKTLAAIGVMKLVESGKIGLDSTLDSNLTRWRLPDSLYDRSKVTVRRVLSHTAGLSLGGYLGYPPDIGLPSLEQSLAGNLGNRFWWYNCQPVSLFCEPGTTWSYSGGGYTALQLAVEEASKRDFGEYMDQDILGPMGMAHSSFAYPAANRVLLSKAYDGANGELPNFVFAEKAAAGLYATADDLALLCVEMMKSLQGQTNNLVISQASLKTMMAPVMATTNSDQEIGLGLFIQNLPGGKRTYGHTGGNQGWKLIYEFCPETQDGIVVLTNSDNGRGSVAGPIVDAWRAYLNG